MRNDGGAAFPLPAQVVRGLDDPTGEFPRGSGFANLALQPGISVRDLFAISFALVSRVVSGSGSEDPEAAYKFADKMLAEREKP